MSFKVYVGNISYRTREDDLRNLFSNHGEVLSVHYAKDRETGRFRGFAFVEMADKESMEAAIRSLDGKEVDTRQLRVKEAEDRQQRAPRRDAY
jgi:RNA recognition motif-containing protein